LRFSSAAALLPEEAGREGAGEAEGLSVWAWGLVEEEEEDSIGEAEAAAVAGSWASPLAGEDVWYLSTEPSRESGIWASE
jgi:hypothetical protein